jgi:hypothetical protein
VEGGRKRNKRRVDRARQRKAAAAATRVDVTHEESECQAQADDSATGEGAKQQPRPDLREGRLVVFLQNSFWANAHLNLAVDRRARMHGEYATRLQYALLDWLKARKH